MEKCAKCGADCGNDDLFCPQCGEKLDVSKCRKCGSAMAKQAAFCGKCGYPAHGKVCSACGAKFDDEAVFCSACGAKLDDFSVKANGAGAKAARPAKKSGAGAFAYKVTRAFIVPLLLVSMFISSFFGVFKVDVPLVGVDATVTGFDAVRGMFLLIDPPSEEEVTMELLEKIVKEVGSLDKEALIRLDKEALIRDFGVMRLLVTEESVNTYLVMHVLLWGLQSLAVMALTLIFFIMSLVHAIYVVLRKKDGFFRFEKLSLALVTALVFGFLFTGEGVLAGAAVANVVLGCAGLAFTSVCAYVVEKVKRPPAISLVRRSVCAALAVMLFIFAGSSVIGVKFATYDGANAIDPDVTGYLSSMDLVAGMDDCFESGNDDFFPGTETEGSRPIGEDIREMMISFANSGGGDLSKSQLRLIIAGLGSPTTLGYIAEAKKSYGPISATLSWFMYIANLLTAAALVMLLYKMLMQDADPGKIHKTLLWHILTVAGTSMILLFAGLFIGAGAKISGDLNIGFSYVIGALPIITVIFAVGALVCDIVMRRAEKAKI